MFEFILAVAVVAAFDLAAMRWGTDSRPITRDETRI
jgi:hypothetical protein